MIWGGLACLVHSLFPFLFTRTASVIVGRLVHEMTKGRSPKDVA
jgi:hypothetical protein